MVQGDLERRAARRGEAEHAPSIATAIVAIAGCERWLMKRRSAAVTIIQRRSHSGPVSVSRNESTAIPRQDFTG